MFRNIGDRYEAKMAASRDIGLHILPFFFLFIITFVWCNRFICNRNMSISTSLQEMNGSLGTMAHAS